MTDQVIYHDDERAGVARVCHRHGRIYDTIDDPDLPLRQSCHEGPGGRWECLDLGPASFQLCRCCLADTRHIAKWHGFLCRDCNFLLGHLRGTWPAAPNIPSGGGPGAWGTGATTARLWRWFYERLGMLIGYGEGDPLLTEVIDRARAEWTKEEAFGELLDWWLDCPLEEAFDWWIDEVGSDPYQEPVSPSRIPKRLSTAVEERWPPRVILARTKEIRAALKETLDAYRETWWFSELYVCRLHGTLYEWNDWSPQRHGCRRCLRTEADPFEIAAILHLCRCCVSDVVISGFLTASLYCDECHDRLERVVDGPDPIGIPLSRNVMIDGVEAFGVDVRDDIDPGVVRRHEEAVARTDDMRWARLWLATKGMIADPLLDQVVGLASRGWTKEEAVADFVDRWRMWA